jgi:DNA-binding LytR/AlgR family response regulator
VAGIFFYFRYQFLRKRIDHILTSKEETIDPSQLITFAGQGTKDCIRLSVTNFLFGKAQDNYVELYYQEQKSVKKFLLRASLKKLTESIANPAIQRSHRSYMVNLYHVNAVKGGQNELSLFLDPLDMPIPVSKTFKGAILKQLRILKNFT